jgi:hypothetical protein
MAFGQSSLPSSNMGSCTNRTASGGLFGPPPGSSLFPSKSDLCKQHMGPTSKPCIKIDSSAKPQVINHHIFEHLVSVTNSCGQHIKVKICYHNSQSCIMVDAPPWGREDKVLGIFPALRDFRYDYTEQF